MERILEKKESAASTERFWLPFFSLDFIGETFQLQRRDLHLEQRTTPAVHLLLVFYSSSPLLGHSQCFTLSLAVRWQCRSTDSLSSLSLWKMMVLQLEWLIEPQIFYFHPSHFWRLRHLNLFCLNEMELAAWDGSSSESSVAQAFALSPSRPSFVRRGLGFFCSSIT